MAVRHELSLSRNATEHPPYGKPNENTQEDALPVVRSTLD